MPSFGAFPRGCRWREVHSPDESAGGGAPVVTYQYRVPDPDEDGSGGQPAEAQEGASSSRGSGMTGDEGGGWTDEQPPACRLDVVAPADGQDGHDAAAWLGPGEGPRSEVVPHKTHVLYSNLWYNGGRWYALVDGPKHVPSWKLSRNLEVTTLHVADAQAWANSVRWASVPGSTLVFDYIYYVHPTAIGHWWEMMGPLYSVLKRTGFKRPCDQFVLLHLQRKHLMDWVRAVMAVTLGMHAALPRLVLQEAGAASPAQQLTMQLEGVAPGQWLVFEKALIVRDIFTGGVRSFHSQEDAREFRAAMYHEHGMPAPAVRSPVPRIITFQRKSSNRRILNEGPFLELLQHYGEVRVVEFNSRHSLQQQLMAMSETGMFVSVHTSALANCMFLQPGSAVVELIQRHWTWMKLDQSFRTQTDMLADVHHFAWRANHPNETVYIDPDNARKFANWTKTQCFMEECVEASTAVDVVVDLVAFKALLDSRLPLVFAGTSKEEADIPWPEAL